MTRGQRLVLAFQMYARVHTYAREYWGKNRATAIPPAWRAFKWKWKVTRA